MPVPVPTRAPAHPVNKFSSKFSSSDASPSGLAKQSALRHLLNSFPEPVSGSLPAASPKAHAPLSNGKPWPPSPPKAIKQATEARDTWPKPLPSHRRHKAGQVVVPLHSEPSLVSSGVLENVKDTACLSKLHTPPITSVSPPSSRFTTQSATMLTLASAGGMDSKIVRAPLSNGKPWPPSPPEAIKYAIEAEEKRKAVFNDKTTAWVSFRDADDELSEDWTEDEAFFAGPTMHRQPSVKGMVASKENKEDIQATGGSAMSLPVVDSDTEVIPLEPFNGSFGACPEGTRGTALQPSLNSVPAYPPVGNQASSCGKEDPIGLDHVRRTLTPIPTTITPTDMHIYNKRIAEPMSEWVAEYIWKVVTHGMSLPPEFISNETGYGLRRSYAAQPPAYLADSIRTLLCSTLLQPSAIFLALWYIARLPVFFGVFAYDSKIHSKEFKFRLELLGEGSRESGAERTRQLLEAHAPFRLILLGVMLANKWLDDNTFSNKTWHQVSGVPMRALNRLESLGLDLLSHDLSMLPQAWEQWLDHVQSYHRSLAPYPEPIGPPKDTPHAAIRRTIEDLVAAGAPPLTTGVIPEPVFLGLEELKKQRERERLAKEENDLLELDLDEDGPLREEYLPKRRREVNGIDRDKNMRPELRKALPPPAEWSPAADPPIHRIRPTYQAVQRPPPAPVPAHAHAHIREPASHVAQSNGYFPRADSFFQDRATGHSYMQAPGHNQNSSWVSPEETKYNTPAGYVPYQQPIQSTYMPVYCTQYPICVTTTHHAAPWSTHILPDPQKHFHSMYQPAGAFDAPPPSELLRPTWLRT